MGRMLSSSFLKKGVLSGAPGISTFSVHMLGFPFFLFQRVCLRRCWVSSFGGIFSPGAISGNLHPSAVQRRTDFLSSPLGGTSLVWLPAMLGYCGLSLASWGDYLSGLLTRYLLPVWVIKCPAPLSFRHAYPCLGKA